MERQKSYTQTLKTAFQLAMRLLHEIEKNPERAGALAARRFAFAVSSWPNGVGAEPIDHTTTTNSLRSPHPMAGCTVPGALVGRVTLYEEWIITGQPLNGWIGQINEDDGYSALISEDGEEHPLTPMELIPSRDGREHLGTDWDLEDYSRALDHMMPQDVRERIAARLETAGEQPDETRKGQAGCRTTGKIRYHSERVLPGSRMRRTHDLVWPPVALAAMVREAGLVIDPVVLLQRFNIRPDGRKPAIMPSSHA